jgi:iron complex transport system ATP-binding protein
VVKRFWFEAKNINCFKNEIRVIKDLNLKLAYTENVILIGPNGSGKSSLIELMNRSIYPVKTNKSKLKIFNKELINLWELRKRISTVNNEIKNRINPNLKVFDLILSGLYGRYCYIQNKSERDFYKVEKIMNNMNISNLSKKNFSYLSDGEKQISLIARALIIKPDILILDEPTANLDYKSKFFVVDKISELSKLNTKIFCVTHDISMITKIYDRVVMLKNGKIIADGFQHNVINSENLNELYGIEVEVTKKDGFWNITRLSK